MIYLIHLDSPLAHARHYLGYTDDSRPIEKRIAEHRSGHGARMLAVANERGINYRLVRVWPGLTRTNERTMKNRAHIAKLCPLCRAEHIEREKAQRKFHETNSKAE